MNTTTGTALAPAECAECHELSDPDGMYSDPYRRGRGDICGLCSDAIDEHLDPKKWTKRTLLGHLFQHDRSFYTMSADTKAEYVHNHRGRHERAAQHAARLVELAPVITDLRERLGCRMDEGSLAAAGDDWLADHIFNHESGNDLGGLLQ